MRLTAAVLIWTGWLGALAGCRPQAPDGAAEAAGPSEPGAHGGPVADTVESWPDPGALATVRSAPVGFGADTGRPAFEVSLRTAEQVSGPARRFGTVTRGIALRTRTPALVQYPCTSCHLGARIVMAERVPDAHQNIRPVHPRATGAVCSTCHAAEDVGRLRVSDGDPPSLDHAYRLCGQCHFRQVGGWAGGAHGKRLDGWRGRRVVMGCSDCHDPHDPGLAPRVPFRGPELPSAARGAEGGGAHQ